MANKENTFNSGALRGQELGKAILEDNWERQAYLMERKQREVKIADEVGGPDIAAIYHDGFTRALLSTRIEGMTVESATDKISEWISNLRPLGEEAKADGRQIARDLIKANKDQDRLRVNAVLSKAEEMKQKHRGIQRREFDHGYRLEVHEAAKALAREAGLEIPRAKETLYDLGIPESP